MAKAKKKTKKSTKSKAKTTSAKKSSKKTQAKKQSNPYAKVAQRYDFPGITIGSLKHEDKVQNVNIKLSLNTLNRHGLIAGATGTGKTKTLQVITEKLSEQGVPVLMMDLKGDLGGLAQPGESKQSLIDRQTKIGLDFKPQSFPVEFYSISKLNGARMRATVTEFGPILLSRILGLNDAQSGIVAIVFRYCDDNGYLLLDLKDFRKVLQYIIGEGKSEIESMYGSVSKASVGTIMRKIVALEGQGAARFFGEKSFDVNDLLTTDSNKRGLVSIIRLNDMIDKDDLFSTFMLQLLSEIYENLPEAGDVKKPKLVLFIDEAHLLFKKGQKELLKKVETMVKLIRSKGVGLVFCTQNPNDLPDSILGQLGLKVQHSLRAFTAKDRKAIKQMSENFPTSKLYDIAELLTDMGIGEALVTGLGPDGRPTPVAHTYLCAPQSRMDVLPKMHLDKMIQQSAMVSKYNDEVDRNSAYEILTAKLESIEKAQEKEAVKQTAKKTAKTKAKVKKKTTKRTTRKREEKSTLEEFADSKFARDIGRTVARELTRGILGSMGVKTPKKRRKRRTTKKKSSSSLTDLLGELF